MNSHVHKTIFITRRAILSFAFIIHSKMHHLSKFEQLVLHAAGLIALLEYCVTALLEFIDLLLTSLFDFLFKVQPRRVTNSFGSTPK